jgi:hypothetical protein
MRGPGRCWSAPARAGSEGWSGWTTGHGSTSPAGPSTGSSCPSGRCSASLPDRQAGADGQQQLRAVSFADSLPRLAYGGGSHHTSCGMLTRNRDGARRDPVADYPEAARACAPRDHVGLPPRYRYARDRRHGPPPPATGDPGERRPAAITRTRGARGRRIARPFFIAGLRSVTAPRASAADVVRLL